MNKIAGTIHARNGEGPPLDSRKGSQGSSDQVRGAHSQKWQHGGALNILLDDVEVTKQLLDLVFYLLIVLGGYKQETHNDSMPLMHSAMVACSLYLLTGCICSQWPDLAHVLLAHPKVDVFMDAAFGAVLVAIRFSLQFPQSLCQQKMFLVRLLRNKLLSLCESESLSNLDDVASSPGSLDLAKSVALEANVQYH
uniref:Nodulin homeobox N-terminal domain-containing protein n=1 Tax=Quercus lobata TaxID=97700 RepID=A0A7N2N3X8_QUELO